ncbi:YbaK/EbsC family protein [Kistimonas asteriae]|uniref:YbaK/EbsC family protein n=1 Tax=Kistimonas asteriae TaxID=517724 RepID=UPI001BACB8D4|nr:YbaK/EbsC family protein [Kistimonas asteriae]
MRERLEQIYQRTVAQLNEAGVKWQRWEHEPILDFETDAKLAAELGWTAEPSKSLFLRLKDGRYCIYLTHRDARLDSKAVRQLLGSRPSVCSPETMQDVIGCLPGAVCPFGQDADIVMVVDPRLKGLKEIMFTPGLPEMTVAIAVKDLDTVLSVLPNPVFWLEEAAA